MKKSLIALAVAGAFAAPAFAASSNVDVYGTIRMSVDNTNSSAANADRWTINDRVSRIGFKGSEDLGGGLKAIWQIEQQLQTTDPVEAAATSTSTSTGGITTTTTTTTTNSTNSGAGGAFGGGNLRNTFVGVAGGFGTVIIGRHDTPYKLGGSADLFADTAADSQASGSGIIGRNGFDNRANGTVAYISPEWSGFHFAAAVIPGEEGTGTAAGNDANGLMDAYSMVGVYVNGPLKVTAGYEKFSGEAQSTTVTTAADRDAFKLNGSYKFGDITVGLTHERSDDTGAAATHTTDTANLASLAYGMGPITLAVQYGKFNDDTSTAAGGNDLSRWTLGGIYNLSKRTNVYAAYNSDNNNGTGVADVKTITMGVNHSF